MTFGLRGAALRYNAPPSLTARSTFNYTSSRIASRNLSYLQRRETSVQIESLHGTSCHRKKSAKRAAGATGEVTVLRRSVLLTGPLLMGLLTTREAGAVLGTSPLKVAEQILVPRAQTWQDPECHTVLLLGGTGRVGGQVLSQLLERGHSVRAIVRSPEKLPSAVAANPRLSVIRASILDLSPADMAHHLKGCDAAVSCLGHPATLEGIYGEPKHLCCDAVKLLCEAVGLHEVGDIAEEAAVRPLRVILLSTTGVDNPDGTDSGVRGAGERIFASALAAALPPYQDNIDAAEFLASSPAVEWTVVRPDDLLEGQPSPYALYSRLNNGLFNAGTTTIANVAAFMVELVADNSEWERWHGRFPQVVNVQPLDA